MRPESSPAELTELANRLFARSVDEPTGALRNRVMQSVAHELALPQQPSSVGQAGDWQWAAIAAAVLIVMNLSMVFASQTEFLVWSRPNRDQTASEIHAVRVLEAQQEGAFK